MFRSRGLAKSNCVAVDNRSDSESGSPKRSDSNFDPGGTLRPYPESGSPPKEFREIRRVEKDEHCSIL